MRQALRRNSLRQATAVGRSIPSPVGGWNAREGLAEMDPRDAVVLENWFPEPGQCRLRRGYAANTTGITGTVESLMAYHGPSSSKLFGAAGTKIYDVTSAGAVGAAAASGLTSARWYDTLYGNTAGSHLIACNGADGPQKYSGSSWGAMTLSGSGLTTSNLIYPFSHQRRMWFLEKSSMNAWFLPTEAISGTLAQYDLGPLFSKGGSLMAGGTWTRDGGSGADDIAWFITSRGQVALFAGTDPTDAAFWGMIGVFDIGAPIGRRCSVKVGSDVGLITQDGAVPLSAMLGADRTQAERFAISSKIGNAFTDAARLHGSKFGWQAIAYPKGNMALFNIPTVENALAEQYVMNTLTGAWAKFKNQNASCWTVFNDDLYFGGSTKTFKADTGTSDDGADIVGDLQPAFNYMGARGKLKRFTMCRPVLASDGAVVPAMSFNVDFSDIPPTAIPSAIGSGGSAWDTVKWDTVPWAGALTAQGSWASVVGQGYCAAPRIRVRTNALQVVHYSFDVTMEGGAFV